MKEQIKYIRFYMLLGRYERDNTHRLLGRHAFANNTQHTSTFVWTLDVWVRLCMLFFFLFFFLK